MKKLLVLACLFLSVSVYSQDSIPIKIHKGNIEILIRALDLSTERHDVIKFFIEEIVAQTNAFIKAKDTLKNNKPVNTQETKEPEKPVSTESSTPIKNKPEALKPKKNKSKQ